jgi:AAA family ATP:ADP antiporter
MFFDIRREELPLALLMAFYFFLVITSFWILKPIKKTLFIGFYQSSGLTLGSLQLTASQAELLAKVMNMVVAIAAVAVFTWLTRWFRRQQLTYVFSAFFMASYIAYSFVLDRPGGFTVWSFYLFGDLYSTLMVATFFAFLNDSVTPDKARRLYGLVGLGGVVGGAFGSLMVSLWIDRLSFTSWLWITSASAVVIVIVAAVLGALVRKESRAVTAPEAPPGAKASRANAALEGARLVFRSPYLLSIVGIVGLYEIVSTVLDFQFTSTVAHYVPTERIGQHFSTVYAITNFVAMGVQLFLTGFVMSRLGVKTALSVLPAMVILGSALFLAVPVLLVGSFLNTADNGFSYSINQSAKEALYVPTTRDEKYKAKAFIDMFVQRFAKALAVGVSLGITTVFTEFSTVRWLSLFVLAIMSVWVIAIRYAGNKFDRLAEGRQAASPK